MLQVLRDFKHFNNCSILYDKLLGKVKIDHYVRKIGLLKIQVSKKS